MTDGTKKPEKMLILRARPEREELICSCYGTLGYQLEKARHGDSGDHGDTELIFLLEAPERFDAEKEAQCRTLLEKLAEIDKKVTHYYLRLVCLIGLIGAVCLGLSFAALWAGLHILFTILLILGIFGCTITLYLRPFFTGMGMKKYGGGEPALIAELQALLELNAGGDEA